MNAVEMKQMVMEESEKVMELINKGVRVYIDDHVSFKIAEEKLEGIAVISTGHICPIFPNEKYGFSLNSLYVDEQTNRLHLSQCGVAGVLNMTGKTFEEAIEVYNSNKISSKKITEYKIFEV